MGPQPARPGPRPGRALGDRLRADVSPTIESSPKVNGSISPITRDLRFAPPGSLPYKDHLMINLWDGPRKKTAPTLRVRIATDAVGFAAGAASDPDALVRWREAVSGDAGDELLRMLDDLTADLDGPSLSLSDPELKRVPAGHDPDRAAAGLLRHKSFQVRFLRPPPDAADPAFGTWVADELVRLGPVHLWLTGHLS